MESSVYQLATATNITRATQCALPIKVNVAYLFALILLVLYCLEEVGLVSFPLSEFSRIPQQLVVTCFTCRLGAASLQVACLASCSRPLVAVSGFNCGQDRGGKHVSR